MVRRRDQQSDKQPTPEEIEAFASGAGDGKTEMDRSLDPDAKHDFKSILVPFNKYEYTKLEAAAKETGRSRLNFIRRAILKLAEEVHKKV